MTEQSTDSFRRYLEESGTVDCIANALAALFELEEKPKQAIDFLKSQLGAPTVTDYEQLAQEKDKLELELSEAKSQIEQLESKLEALLNTKEEQVNDEEPNE